MSDIRCGHWDLCFLPVYARMNVCEHTCECEDTCSHTGACGGQRRMMGVTLYCSLHLIALSQGSCIRNSPFKVGWLVSEGQGSFSLCLREVCDCVHLLMWVLGIWTWLLLLLWQPLFQRLEHIPSLSSLFIICGLCDGSMLYAGSYGSVSCVSSARILGAIAVH